MSLRRPLEYAGAAEWATFGFGGDAAPVAEASVEAPRSRGL
jgi:hypothetical protein